MADEIQSSEVPGGPYLYQQEVPKTAYLYTTWTCARGSEQYLGVNISDDLSWKTHVDKTAAKASSTLGFLRCNLINCTKEVRKRTYNIFVLPTLEYAAIVWDPFLSSDINRLEQVQQRGARYVHSNYWDRTPGCVT